MSKRYAEMNTTVRTSRRKRLREIGEKEKVPVDAGMIRVKTVLDPGGAMG